MTASIDTIVARMAAAEARLAEHAAAPLPVGLADPDPGAEERWEAGQVWAHLAEFPSYWLAQARSIVDAASDDPVPFGRVKTDPERLAAIERDRHTDPAALLARVRDSLAEVTDALRAWPPPAWNRRGLHPTRGVMGMEEIVERFVVEHLEEHADQLDSLVASDADEA
jgi:hypothetical protein